MYSRWSVALIAGVTSAVMLAGSPRGEPAHHESRAALPPGAIKHVLVIDLENEDFLTRSAERTAPIPRSAAST